MWSVPVPARVSAGRILFEVRAHRIAGQVKADARGALTAQAPVSQSEIAHVGNEVRFPRPVARYFSSLATVIAFLAIESVAKCKAIAQNEVEIAEAIDHLRRIGKRNQARGFASLRIEMLLPSV